MSEQNPKTENKKENTPKIERKGRGEVPAWKKEKVKELTTMIQQTPLIGVIDLTGVPSKQLQDMRHALRDKMKIITTKKAIIQHALTNAGLEGLNKYLRGIPALVFSHENAFKLGMILDKRKVSVLAKPGDIAPHDIIVPAGPTNLMAGPLIGELAMAGIKAKVEGGKLTIVQDVVVAKRGDVIDEHKAKALARLDIKPMKLGLELLAVSEEGAIYTGEEIKISEEEYAEKFTRAYTEAINLAYNANVLIKETIKQLLIKAYSEAINLGVNANMPSPEIIKTLLCLTNAKAFELSKKINAVKPEALSEELKELINKSTGG